ncbi:MAG TPA: sugar phosphate isomerase/epimerase [Bacillota bacterium]|nr:sugar phosphate isomerase/epimerase [Clostridiales bacterium]HPT84373.1 sugar phosphate isomerase/epimerase [Bacillota bacterium]
MKLGIAAQLSHSSPEEWAKKHKELGLSAVVFPLDYRADTKLIDAYAEAARGEGLTIAEVGAWCNPISPDPAQRTKNVEYCARQLELADYVGALCCVNIAGAVGEVWDGGYRENYLPETYDAIVESVRKIIDTAKPRRAKYALETMPWMYPDSPESYLKLISDIGRPELGVHLDIVNMLNCPERYFNNAEFTRRCFELLGDKVLSCHLKDTALRGRLTISIEEAFPGTGGFDIPAFLRAAEAANPEMPVIIEHLSSEGDYIRAAKYVLGLMSEIL